MKSSWPKIKSFILLTFLSINAFGEGKDSTLQVDFNGIIEPYYSWKQNATANNRLPSVFSNYRNSNQFNVNLALLNVDLTAKKFRSSIGLMAGTYPDYNLVNESETSKHIYQAFMGYSPRADLWIEAGIFPSHIGFESANPLPNWTLTRSLIAENSPYYLTGAKLLYTLKQLTFSAGLVNGWQTIAERDLNKAVITQLNFTKANTVINFSGYHGKEEVSVSGKTPENRMRHFFNFYFIQKFGDRFNVVLGFDRGIQEASIKNTWFAWSGMSLIVKQKISSSISISERVEYYYDPHNIVVSFFRKDAPVYGASLNVDYAPLSFLIFRVEPRFLHSDENLFPNKNTFVGSELFVTSSAIVKF